MIFEKLVIALAGLLLMCDANFALAETPRRIEIAAKKFSYTPNEITLKKGEPGVP